MGGRGGGGANGVGKGSNGISVVPASSRKIVQSLKEIVNCSESEIYAMLVECNMDPDEAVNRLLTQDTFHEVKSKREKKKESKDIPESRLRGTSNTSSRASRVGIDRYASRGAAKQFSSCELGSLHGKPANKKENGARAHAGSSYSASGITGRQPPPHSDSIAPENKMPSVNFGAGRCSTSQVSSGHQPAWSGAAGQVTMADIVKMGRQQSKASAVTNATRQNTDNHEFSASQHVPFKEEWPSIEKPAAVSAFHALKDPLESEMSRMPPVIADQYPKSEFDEVLVAENHTLESHGTDQAHPASVSDRNIHEDSRGSSLLLDDVHKSMESYRTQSDMFEHGEAEEVASSVAADLQQLNIENDDSGALHEDDKPGVIIPNHLQVHTSDCLQLSFGSFGAAIGSGFPDSAASGALDDHLEEAPDAGGALSIEPADTRNSEVYGDEQVRMPSNENGVGGINASAGNYDSSADSQAEALKQETSEAAESNQYIFSSSAPGYTFEDTQQSNTAFAPTRASPQMQNFASFANEMQGYASPLSSTLLASTVQSGREPDFQYSPFPVTQSVPTTYHDTPTSLTGPTISMAEALRAGGIPASQPTQQTLPGANMASGPGLPQHVAMHPYSQPTLPLGHYASLIGYPFLAQNYPYMPSAFQQAFAGNSTYHQSLAAMLPQYKNSVSVGSLSQSAAPGYGFGSSSHLPGGNFPLNPLSAPQSTTIGYDDVLSSQYKDNGHLMSLQQNDNSAMWVQGPGSRSVSAVPASTYYSLLGQNQQAPGFRQAQQPSQHFGALGYPNMYNSQTGLPLEHQHQNPREAALGGPQGLAPKPNQPLWQNGY